MNQWASAKERRVVAALRYKNEVAASLGLAARVEIPAVNNQRPISR